MSKYTIYGSKDFDARLDVHLQTVKLRFLDSLDPNDIHALILGGGYGRGEGGVLFEHDTEHLYNDLDLFVISKDIGRRKLKKMNIALHDLHKTLSSELGLDVDFSPVQRISVLPRAPFILMWYDLLRGHKVVYGKENILQYLPNWDPRDLPLEEALKLSLNRGMGLYFAREAVEQGKFAQESDFIFRNINKAYQAMGESILIAEACYHHSGLEKIKKIKELNLEFYGLKKDFTEEFEASMQFKFRPTRCTWDEATCKNELTKALTDFKRVYYALWSKQCLCHINNAEQYRNAVRYIWQKETKPGELLKNVLYNLRDTRGKQLSFELMLRYPRFRLFYAFAWMLFGEEHDLDELAYFLGVHKDEDQSVLRSRFIDLWKKYN